MSQRYARWGLGVEYILVLHDADPAGLLAIAGAEPNVVRVREADFDGEVGPEAVRARELLVYPRAELVEARLRVGVGNRPFCRMLWVLDEE